MSASGAGSTLSLEIVPATRGRRTHSWAGSTGLGVCVCVCVCVCVRVCVRACVCMLAGVLKSGVLVKESGLLGSV